MINLLPPEEKELLHKGQQRKLIIILGTTVIISLVCLWLVLLAIQFHIMGESANVKIALKQAEVKYQTQHFLLYKQRIQDANASFAKINQNHLVKNNTANVLPFLSAVQKPAGVKLNRINLASQSTGTLVALSGTSDTRENLMAFKTHLESQGAVKNMDFPANNWLKPANLEFYLTFEYAEK